MSPSTATAQTPVPEFDCPWKEAVPHGQPERLALRWMQNGSTGI